MCVYICTYVAIESSANSSVPTVTPLSTKPSLIQERNLDKHAQYIGPQEEDDRDSVNLFPVASQCTSSAARCNRLFPELPGPHSE